MYELVLQKNLPTLYIPPFRPYLMVRGSFMWVFIVAFCEYCKSGRSLKIFQFGQPISSQAIKGHIFDKILLRHIEFYDPVSINFIILFKKKVSEKDETKSDLS